jgi:hypothetical protein
MIYRYLILFQHALDTAVVVYGCETIPIALAHRALANWNTMRKPLTCHKSLTNIIT